MPLTDTDRAILDLERSWWKYPGAKETAIHDQLGMSPTRFYQRLNVLIDTPEALEAESFTVRRLLRLREARRAQRAAR